MKYLGGITFLLSDGCPEAAEQANISQYFQCLQSEKLHVSMYFQCLQSEKLHVIMYFSAYNQRNYT